MLRKLNAVLIVGMSFFYFPAHSKDILKEHESSSSSMGAIVEEMIHLNANLDLLTNTVSNLMPKREVKSNL